jgi:voltage-gated potassium channel Kch
VVLSLGAAAGHLKYESEITGMAALAFALLAALSTFGMSKSDEMARALIPWLKRCGLRDLDQRRDDLHAEGAEGHGHPQARILFLGFFRTASSLLEEMQRHSPDLIKETAVVDFSPVARAGLVARKVPVIYGDISQRDTLLHAGVEKAEILICTVPDALLKGINNERLVRLLRGLNPNAKIIATADVLSHANILLQAGADYVSVARLREAGDLLQAVVAASEGLLDQKRDNLKDLLDGRMEVLP